MIESAPAPDVAEPLVGYRVWTLLGDGLLRPHAAGDEPWAIGVNEAKCLTQGHFAPAPNCGCGLNALHRPPAHYVADLGSAVGAIAAWGTIDLFRTGFRAELGCVLALAIPLLATDEHARRLQVASQVYDVQLVDIRDLAETACAFASPASEELLPAPKRPRGMPAVKRHYAPPPRQSLAVAMSGDGVWLDKHVAVAHEGPEARIGPTPALSAVVDRFVAALDPGERVSEGAPLFRVATGGRELDCPSPLAGTVEEVRHFAADPWGGPRGDGWLVKVKVDPEPPDYWPLVWGIAGADTYRRHVLAAESDAALITSLADERGQSSLPIVGSTRWLADFADRLDVAIEADASIRDALRQLGLHVGWELRDGGALTVGPPSGGGRWAAAASLDGADLHFELDPTSLIRYWEGRLQLNADNLSLGPLRAGRQVEVDRRPAHLIRGTRGQAIFAMSIHRRLIPAARAAITALGNPWFRAGDAVRDGQRNRIALGGAVSGLPQSKAA